MWRKRLCSLQALVAAAVLAAVLVEDVFLGPAAALSDRFGGSGARAMRGLASSYPPSAAACAAPAFASAPRALVVAKYREDSSWVDLFFGDIPHYVYHMAERDGALGMPKNVGNEATAYLRFIVEHYDALPERTAFVQAHRLAHHPHKVDIVPLLLAVNWAWADYVPLNLYMFQHLTRQKSPEFAALQDLWPVLFSDVGPDPPPDMLTWCCAQFIASRAAIRRLPLAHWRRLYDWILSEEMRTLRTGVIMEHAWPAMLDVRREANVEPCDLMNCTEFERLSAAIGRGNTPHR